MAHSKSSSILAVCKANVGCKYQRLGRSFDTGVDCAGWIIVVAREAEVTDFESIKYSQRPDPHQFKQELLRMGCFPIPRSDLATGDIVRLAEHRWPVHCGIVELDDSGQWWLYHAWGAKGIRRVLRDRLLWAKVRDMWRMPDGDASN